MSILPSTVFYTTGFNSHRGCQKIDVLWEIIGRITKSKDVHVEKFLSRPANPTDEKGEVDVEKEDLL
ncbi:hypothetical protein BDZ91DRAFT_792953 [Kalaharituber pfeilii]|nr:hypothetical protein BDZ91DRAFT_792953 [Kalaharituber pfeilii]